MPRLRSLLTKVGQGTLACDENGSFFGDTFAPGVYYVRVEAEGFVSSERMIEIPVSGGLPSLIFVLNEGASVTGNVTRFDGPDRRCRGTNRYTRQQRPIGSLD